MANVAELKQNLQKKIDPLFKMTWDRNVFLKLLTEVNTFNAENKTEFIVVALPTKMQIMHIDDLVEQYKVQAFESFKSTLRTQIRVQNFITVNEYAQIHT